MAMARVRMLMFAAVACCFLMGSASAHENETNVKQPIKPINHIVGGSFGWRLPETNKTFYDDWARNRVFAVNDTLVFPYRSGTGTVVQVGKKDYEHCTQKHIKYMFYSGPTSFILHEPGDYYFYNGNGKHCEGGQKLHVRACEGVQGSSGTKFSFKINLAVDRKSSPVTASKGASAPAPSPVVAAAAPAPKASAATTIQNVGVASGLFTILFSLFI
ncbi:early nodulin-like protein 3 [Argentina anserina]|uniref:early nodulin-like protein 3 n=1 Tax=Argentina anserina TaxID=57926 RepID=UPI0021763030|nr:early nodulin-like protein 3 [Potentilla anserina]